MRVSG
ncbi:hypothetical protein M0802_012208 [Mischocyttarus mexicanus]